MRNRTTRLTAEPLEDRLTPATINVPALTTGFSPVNNNYRVLADALDAANSGDVIVLSGNFDWTEPNARAAWAIGNDGTAGNIDDYSVTVRGGKNNVTVTAASLGAAVIQGPGDVPVVDLDGVFNFIGGPTPADKNQGWTISNLTILDFDLGIGMFGSGAGPDAFNGTTITNNRIRIATDLSTAAAPADAFQNVGINFSFGTGQTISNNTIEIPGDAPGSTADSSTIGIQSDSSGGAIYDGLRITGNTIRVLSAAPVAAPQRIVGIWENGSSHGSNILISGNQFLNAPGTNPAANVQQAFVVTSHSGPNSSVTYAGNTVTGANVGFAWLSADEFPGTSFAGNRPVVMLGNTLNNVQTGFLVQSDGLAAISGGNVVTGTATGTGVVVRAGSIVSVAGGSFTGTGVGIDVTGGTLLVQNTDLNRNAIAGLRVSANGRVDAGGGGFTGLGTSTGGNNFADYLPTSAGRAIINLNTDAGFTGAPTGAVGDLAARNNTFASAAPAFIEQVIDHDVDVSTRGFVDFSAPAPGGNVAPVVGGQNLTPPAGLPAGALVSQVAASDANGNPLTYSIVGGNTGGAFAIDPATGQITVANPAALGTVPSFALVVQVSDGLAVGTATVTVTPVPAVETPVETPTETVPVFLTAVGADAGANGHVKVYNQDGSLRFSFLAFAGFNGGVRVATGDVNGDAVDDIVVGAGPGAAGGHVKVFDGVTGNLISSFLAFPGFVGGVTVAVGDIDGDGDGDIVVGTGTGSSHVKAFDFATGNLFVSFLAYGAGYTGGVTVAAGNFDGAGGADIITGTALGTSHVKVFDAGQNLLASFLAFPGTDGVNVAAGDLDGDTFAELIVGSGPNTVGQFNVFAGKTAAARGSLSVGGNSGVRVGVGFANSDALLDILVGTGPGPQALLRSFDGATLAPISSLTPFDAFQGGLFVG